MLDSSKFRLHVLDGVHKLVAQESAISTTSAGSVQALQWVGLHESLLDARE